MEEKTLLKVSLIVGLLGLVALYFISSGIDLESIKSIGDIDEEEEVKLSGRVGKVSENGAVVFLEILNEKIEETKVVLFKDGGIDLIEGDYVEILGTVEVYEGEKEIIGNKVIKKGFI
ncbi:hypothetical protein GOV03_01745 [Candidatus Woesearchaeota archaeon]|nr:hypothetical protein [Candidatus Woesearchaeota archaeon]